MLILDLWGISFHPVVVVGLGNDLLFKSSVGHCIQYSRGICNQERVMMARVQYTVVECGEPYKLVIFFLSILCTDFFSNHQAVISRSLGSCQAVIIQSSGRRHAVITQ